MKPALIFRLVMRDWRAGELHLLLAALLVAVGTVTTITMTVARLQSAMLLESAAFLAADRTITSRDPIPADFVQAAQERGLETVDMLLFQSMVLSTTDSARTQLAGVKAVSDGYPLRGTLQVADEPFGQGYPLAELPAIGSIWLDSRLFGALDVEVGDPIRVGYAELTVAKVLRAEPDRQFSFEDMAPRVLMRIEDVPETRVVQPGSRLEYRTLIAGDQQDLDRLYRALEPELGRQYRWRDVRASEPRIGEAMNRAESFFLVGGSLAVLLAGVAIALSAHRYAYRHFDHVGILKTLGATPLEILLSCIGILLILAFVGVCLGLATGGLVHGGLVWYFREYFPPDMPFIGFRPIVMGTVTGLICLFMFALPPFLELKNISPLRVIRRDLVKDLRASTLTYGFAAIGSIAVLVWYSGSFFLTFWLLLGMVIVFVAFSVLALLLLQGGRVVGMQAGSAWRLALAGLRRRYKENTGQIVIFGLAIMLLLVLYLVRTTLISEWRAELPQDTPNHVLLNVVTGQEDGVAEFLERYTTNSSLDPMYRGRIVEVNGEPVREYQERVRSENRPGPRLSSPRELTWAAHKPESNEILAGEWWDEDTDEYLVSVEQGYAQDWSLQLGDELAYQVGGQRIDATITSIRGVEWDESFESNFFMILSPPTLRDIPTTYMAFFHLPDENQRYITELISAYPTITVLDVDSILEQVQLIIDRVTTAVEWVLYLVLGSGALVLIASIQSSRDSRLKEHALLRSLGGTKKLVLGSLTAEFAVLGVMAGLVGVIGAELTVYFIESQILELNYAMRPSLWLIGPAFGGLLIALVGHLGTRKLVHEPPMRILRDV